MKNEAAAIHAFERAGLGKAPFRIQGVTERVGPLLVSTDGGVEHWVGSPGQPMGTCKFCGTGIRECWIIQSSDGKRFDVGCDCVRKTGDSGLRREMTPYITKAKQGRDDARIAAAQALLTPEVEGKLAAQPHPYRYMAEKGHTLLSFVEFNMKNAGRAGKIKAAREIERLTKAKVAGDAPSWVGGAR